MSLTLYFYKTKKGSIPTAKNGTEWKVGRRAYMSYAIMCDLAETAKTKRGETLFKLNEEILNRMFWYIKEFEKTTNYDDACERELLVWLKKRKMDFGKYDFYALAA